METILMYVITVAAAAFLGVNAQAEAKSHKPKEHKEKSHHEKKSRKKDKKHGKDKEIAPIEEQKPSEEVKPEEGPTAPPLPVPLHIPEGKGHSPMK